MAPRVLKLRTTYWAARFLYRPSFPEGLVPGWVSQPVWRILALPGVEVRPLGRPAPNVITIADLAVSAIFKRVRRNTKSEYDLRPVSLSTWKTSAPTGRIFMKFGI